MVFTFRDVSRSANSGSSTPQSVTTTGRLHFPDSLPTASMRRTTSMPSTTEPKTTCLPSSHAVLDVQMKNWDPFVSGPAFAMDRIPGPVCLSAKVSSANVSP